MTFQYRAKFLIRNKDELLRTLDRIGTGITLPDIKDCYDGIESEVQMMVVGGEVMAARSSDKKLVIYPRGQAFYTELSGTVTATPGDLHVKTSKSLLNEIRRGEAIKVGEYWYRVSCAIGQNGSNNEQLERSKTPQSVTLDKDLSEKNVYFAPFTASSIPLDGGFEEDIAFNGVALRHGATTDVKDLWYRSREEMRRLNLNRDDVVDDKLLNELLLSEGLIDQSGTTGEDILFARNKLRNGVNKKKVRKSRESNMFTGGFGMNTHLKGTQMEKLLREGVAEALAKKKQQTEAMHH